MSRRPCQIAAKLPPIQPLPTKFVPRMPSFSNSLTTIVHTPIGASATRAAVIYRRVSLRMRHMAPGETRTDFHRLNVGVAGFLAGIMFAAMSMLIRFFGDMEYGEILVTLTALDCMLFTLFAFGSVRLASVRSSDTGPFAMFVKRIGSPAMWLFLAIVPLLVLQVSQAGSAVVAAAEILLVALYYKYMAQKVGSADSTD